MGLCRQKPDGQASAPPGERLGRQHPRDAHRALDVGSRAPPRAGLPAPLEPGLTFTVRTREPLKRGRKVTMGKGSDDFLPDSSKHWREREGGRTGVKVRQIRKTGDSLGHVDISEESRSPKRMNQPARSSIHGERTAAASSRCGAVSFPCALTYGHGVQGS